MQRPVSGCWRDGTLQLVDIANAPFLRPGLERLVEGIAWIRNPENSYPIRGTLSYQEDAV